MKLFYSEFANDYSSYRFAYSILAEVEANDVLKDVYNSGYLPYSASPEDPRHLFYMARSLRCSLNKENELFSKSRRYEIRQLAKSFPLIRKSETKEAFLKTNALGLYEKVSDWMKQRYDVPYLNEERFKYISNKPYFNTVLSWFFNDKPVAYAFVNKSETMAHYWFAFLDHKTMTNQDFGSYCMADFLKWAQENKFSHGYLGTGYFPKSTYKTKGLNTLQWWDGTEWNSDKSILVERMMADSQ